MFGSTESPGYHHYLIHHIPQLVWRVQHQVRRQHLLVHQKEGQPQTICIRASKILSKHKPWLKQKSELSKSLEVNE